MAEFLKIFSNREIALFSWILIGFIAMLFSKTIRNSIIDIIKIFFNKTILTIFFTFIGYVVSIVFSLHKLGFWDTSLLKDTILWTFGFAFILVFRANNTTRISDFKKILKDSIKWTIAVEFLVAFYTFSLLVEFIILPVLVFFGMLQAYSDSDEKFKQVSNILKNILSVFGLFVLGYVLYKTFYQSGRLITITNFKTFLLPLILTTLFIPFVYLLSLIMIYEKLFGRINAMENDNQTRKIVKKQILKIANLNLDKLSNISERIIKEHPLNLNNSLERIKQISEQRQNLLDK